MQPTRHAARTSTMDDLHRAGTAILDAFDGLHERFDGLSDDALAMDATDLESAVESIPMEIRTTVPDDYEEPMDEWVQPDFVDWRAVVSDVDVGNPLAEWPGADDPTTAVGVAQAVIQTFLEQTDCEVTVSGAWFPHREDSNRTYDLFVSAEYAVPDASYQSTISVSTGGAADATLTLYAFDDHWDVFSHPLVERSVADDEVPTRLDADVIERARMENWARVVVGSYADAVASRTRLSFHEALVTLLTDVGSTATDEDVAEVLGRGRSSMSTIRHRAKEKYDAAPGRIRIEQRTMAFFDEVTADDVLSDEWVV